MYDFKFTDSYKNFDETYFSVILTGDISEIPMTKKVFSRFSVEPWMCVNIMIDFKIL